MERNATCALHRCKYGYHQFTRARKSGNRYPLLHPRRLPLRKKGSNSTFTADTEDPDALATIRWQQDPRHALR
jgi:hypothetical protein